MLAAVVLSQAPAQVGKEPPKKEAPPPRGKEEDRGGDDYRNLFKTPTNAAEFWNALQFEIDVGKFDLAARHLRGLVNYKATDADLVKLADEVGMAAFLRLRNIQKWSDDPKVDKEAKANVETLIKQVTAAVNKVRKDPVRIQALIKNLNASPEENAYAIKELYRSGAAAVPYLIDALRAAEPGEKLRLLDALRRMGPDTIEPMIAALDSNDPQLQVDLIRIFEQRNARQVVPHLWFLAGSPTQPDAVRRMATEALSYFLTIKPGRLPPAKVELTREAERYYRHEVKFIDPAAVVVWRWDGAHVVQGWPGAPTITAAKAEEYWGMRFAGQALIIDPAYQPAQLVLLSLVLERAQGAAGLDKMLDREAPAVHALLATVHPDLVMAVLDRALREHRLPVILGAVRDLGERDEVRAYRPVGRSQPPLVQALNYPDRRVQMAAVDALMRIPGSAASLATARVVEVLRRAVAAEPAVREPAKVLVGWFNEDVRNGVAAAVADAGFEPVKVSTGREMLQRLNRASDIALLLFEETLPDPGLANLLGQLHADKNAGRLPILLAASEPRQGPLRRFTALYPNVTVFPAPLALDARALRTAIRPRLGDPDSPTLSAAELKAFSEKAISYLARLSRGEPAGYDVTPAGPTVLEALRAPSKLTPEGQIAALEVASRLKGRDAQTVIADVLTDPKRSTSVRVKAADMLVRHIQQYSPLLTRAQVQAIDALYAQPKLDLPLKSKVALVLGSLQPDARLTGQRLLQYQPPPPGPPPKPDK
jgi:hypothetical protein